MLAERKSKSAFVAHCIVLCELIVLEYIGFCARFLIRLDCHKVDYIEVLTRLVASPTDEPLLFMYVIIKDRARSSASGITAPAHQKTPLLG